METNGPPIRYPRVSTTPGDIFRSRDSTTESTLPSSSNNCTPTSLTSSRTQPPAYGDERAPPQYQEATAASEKKAKEAKAKRRKIIIRLMTSAFITLLVSLIVAAVVGKINDGRAKKQANTQDTTSANTAAHSTVINNPTHSAIRSTPAHSTIIPSSTRNTIVNTLAHSTVVSIPAQDPIASTPTQPAQSAVINEPAPVVSGRMAVVEEPLLVSPTSSAIVQMPSVGSTQKRFVAFACPCPGNPPGVDAGVNDSSPDQALNQENCEINNGEDEKTRDPNRKSAVSVYTIDKCVVARAVDPAAADGLSYRCTMSCEDESTQQDMAKKMMAQDWKWPVG